MPDDRYSMWQAEQAGTSSGPTVAQALAMFAAVALVLLALAWSPLATADSGDSVSRGVETEAPPAGGSLCDQHRADPSWSSVCRDRDPGPPGSPARR